MRLFDLLETRINEADPVQNEYGEYTIAAENFEYFEAGLEKINKKARAVGVPDLTIESKERTVDERGRVWFIVKVHGEPVRIKGWEFVATLEHGGDTNVVRGVPGYHPPDLKQYVTSSNKNCDFCHSSRDRNHTYIIQKTEAKLDREFKQVGGACLKKFMGDGAAKLVRFSFGMSSLVAKLANHGPATPNRGLHGLDALTVLTSAAALVRTQGFKKSESWDSTAAYVKSALYDWNIPGSGMPAGSPELQASKQVNEIAKHPTPEDQTTAEQAINWFKNELSDGEKDSSTYLFSLKSIIDADFVTTRSVGLLVSLIPVFARKQAAPLERPEQPAAPVSQHVGTEGQKIPPTKVKVVHTQEVNSQFGDSLLVKMLDDAGNNFTWFDSKFSVEKNDEITITGTVKKHDEYKGVKTTSLIRVKKV